jgi:hypothetical protein
VCVCVRRGEREQEGEEGGTNLRYVRTARLLYVRLPSKFSSTLLPLFSYQSSAPSTLSLFLPSVFLSSSPLKSIDRTGQGRKGQERGGNEGKRREREVEGEGVYVEPLIRQLDRTGKGTIINSSPSLHLLHCTAVNFSLLT